MIKEISAKVDEERSEGFNSGMGMSISSGIFNMSDGWVMELLSNMGVSRDADIRKFDIAKIKVVGRRAMRKYIREKYL